MGNLFYRENNFDQDVGMNTPLPVRLNPQVAKLTFTVSAINDGTSTVSAFNLAHSVTFNFLPRIFSLLTTFTGTGGNLIGGIFIRKEKKNGTSPSAWRMLFSFTGSTSPGMAVPGGTNRNRNYQSMNDIIVLEELAVDERYRIGVGYRANGSNITDLTADFQVRGY